MKPLRPGALVVSLLLSTSALGAQPLTEMPMDALEAPVELRSASPPPLRLGQRPGAQIAYLLPAWQVAALELEEIALWNRMGKTPAKVGFTRMLPEARAVGFEPGIAVRSGAHRAHDGGLVERAVDGALVWGTEVRLEDSFLIRLRLSEVRLPEGTLLWVYGEEGEAVGPFGLELLDPQGNLWTPPVAGPALRLEVRLPGPSGDDHTAAGFIIDRASEIVGPGTWVAGRRTLAPRVGQCLVDSSCVDASQFPALGQLDPRRAIAALLFEDNGGAFVCSGALLNTLNQPAPYPMLLTAHHCFDTQASASSLIAVWDWYTSFCNAPPPDPTTRPLSLGSTLLATGHLTDFTLVRLSSVPANRVLLGWSALPGAAAHGTMLHRFSHPVHPDTDAWLPQQYSRNRVDTTFPACVGAPRPRILYSTFQPGHGMGGTFGGSSGAPAMNDSGQVLGQLFGGCGPAPHDGCDYRNSEVDGAFSETYQVIHSFLQGPDQPCVADATTLCLHGNRFKVEVEWVHDGVPKDANVVQGVATTQSGLFYFLDPTNWEFLIKVLDACALNNRYWVFFAGTTNVGFTVTVTDTATGLFQPYSNNAGQPANAITDTNAFATCP
jgi:lysyl endopeptidase